MKPHEVFNRISAKLAGHTGQANRLVINATHLKAYRTAPACSKWGCTPPYQAHQRRPELQAARRLRRPGPAPRPATLQRPNERPQGHGPDVAQPDASLRIASREGLWQQPAALGAQRIAPASSKRNCKLPIPYDKALYRQRIEITFGRLTDWRRIAARYDRCIHTVFCTSSLACGLI
jgi:hypothetical protein